MVLPIQWRRKRLQRGLSLFEIMVVVAVIALLSGAIAIAAFNRYRSAQVHTATLGARTLRSAVQTYWLDQASADCPTIQDLIRARVLDEDAPRLDPWGKPYAIECEGDRVSVRSNGPDKQPGTEDDIVIPPIHRGDPPSPSS